MAIFKKTTKKGTPAVTKSPASKKEGALDQAVEHMLRPHITEKSAILAEKGTYVFKVSPKANKVEIAKVVRALHKVTPVRVNIVNLPRTRVFVRGKAGMKSGTRKALVTLAKGEKIEFV